MEGPADGIPVAQPIAYPATAANAAVRAGLVATCGGEGRGVARGGMALSAHAGAEERAGAAATGARREGSPKRRGQPSGDVGCSAVTMHQHEERVVR